jgi:hypothetical protein
MFERTISLEETGFLQPYQELFRCEIRLEGPELAKRDFISCSKLCLRCFHKETSFWARGHISLTRG